MKSYVQILEEMLSEMTQIKLSTALRSIFKYFKFVASKEIAVVYNMSISEVEREMKKLQLLARRLEQFQQNTGHFGDILKRVQITKR